MKNWNITDDISVDAEAEQRINKLIIDYAMKLESQIEVVVHIETTLTDKGHSLDFNLKFNWLPEITLFKICYYRENPLPSYIQLNQSFHWTDYDANKFEEAMDNLISSKIMGDTLAYYIRINKLTDNLYQTLTNTINNGLRNK